MGDHITTNTDIIIMVITIITTVLDLIIHIILHVVIELKLICQAVLRFHLLGPLNGNETILSGHGKRTSKHGP